MIIKRVFSTHHIKNNPNLKAALTNVESVSSNHKKEVGNKRIYEETNIYSESFKL